MLLRNLNLLRLKKLTEVRFATRLKTCQLHQETQTPVSIKKHFQLLESADIGNRCSDIAAPPPQIQNILPQSVAGWAKTGA